MTVVRRIFCVGALALGIVLGVITMACGEEAAARCPVDDRVCGVASEVEDILASGDADVFIEHFEERQFECPGPESTGKGEPFPLCLGASAGELRSGYLFLNDSTGTVVSSLWLRDHLSKLSDASSHYHWRVHAIGCIGAEEGGCVDGFVIVIAPLDKTGHEIVGKPSYQVFRARFSDALGWEVVNIASAWFFGTPDLLLDGGPVISRNPHVILEGVMTLHLWRTGQE
jgi:hypothetical protein